VFRFLLLVVAVVAVLLLVALQQVVVVQVKLARLALQERQTLAVAVAVQGLTKSAVRAVQGLCFTGTSHDSSILCTHK
jgi:hypothetical protein